MKNELGGSETQQELRGWGWGLRGHNEMNRELGVYPTPVNSNLGTNLILQRIPTYVISCLLAA